MMRRAITALFVAEIIIMIVLGIMCATARGEAYARPGIVWRAYAGRVLVEDEGGNLWEFLSDGWYKGEHITLIMDDMGTESPYDDIIIWEWRNI